MFHDFEWSTDSDYMRLQLDLLNRLEWAKGVKMPSDNVLRSHNVWTCACMLCSKWRRDAEKVRAEVFGAEAPGPPTEIAFNYDPAEGIKG